MPVSERARYRRFPDAGRPVQVYESHHLREATFGNSPVLLTGAEFLPGKITNPDRLILPRSSRYQPSRPPIDGLAYQRSPTHQRP